jgi:hypothetical protein
MHALLMIPLASALLYACGSDEPDDDGAELPADYEDVVYTGGVTDEALVAFAGALDQGPPGEGAGAPTLVEPTATEAWPDNIPTFRWTFGAAGARREPVEILQPNAPAAAPEWVAPLRELFGPLRAAQAHGTPFTGHATFLVFSTDANPKLLRVFTGETSYIPTQPLWQTLVDAHAPITLTLIGAEFEENRIAQGTKLLKGAPYTFTIASSS